MPRHSVDFRLVQPLLLPVFAEMAVDVPNGFLVSGILGNIATVSRAHPAATRPLRWHRSRMPGDDQQHAFRMWSAATLLQSRNTGRVHRRVRHQRLCGAGRHVSALHRHGFPCALTAAAHLDQPVCAPSRIDRWRRASRAAERSAAGRCRVAAGAVGRSHGLLWIGAATHGAVQPAAMRTANIGPVAFSDRSVIVGHAISLPNAAIMVGADFIGGVREPEVFGEVLGTKVPGEVFDHRQPPCCIWVSCTLPGAVSVRRLARTAVPEILPSAFTVNPLMVGSVNTLASRPVGFHRPNTSS